MSHILFLPKVPNPFLLEGAGSENDAVKRVLEAAGDPNDPFADMGGANPPAAVRNLGAVEVEPAPLVPVAPLNNVKVVYKIREPVCPDSLPPQSNVNVATIPILPGFFGEGCWPSATNLHCYHCTYS